MIDYQAVLRRVPAQPVANDLTGLIDDLKQEWLRAYDDMTDAVNSVHLVERGQFSFLFDLSCEIAHEHDREIQDDRVVVFFGTSLPATDKRDSARMRGFVGPTTMTFGAKYDKGHFISHAAGGGTLDAVNWFPQLRAINRGWSERGKVYRAMERYCADNPGTFFFSRPIYDYPPPTRRSWTPCALEYGVLRDDRLWVETFDNLSR